MLKTIKINAQATQFFKKNYLIQRRKCIDDVHHLNICLQVEIFLCFLGNLCFDN